jgi:hypothetical protein
MFEKTSISATQTFVYKNRYNTTEIEDINSGNLAFSFFAYNNENDMNLNSSVGTFRLFQYTKNGYTFIDDTPIQEMDETEVEYESCHPGSKVFRNNWVDNLKYDY